MRSMVVDNKVGATKSIARHGKLAYDNGLGKSRMSWYFVLEQCLTTCVLEHVIRRPPRWHRVSPDTRFPWRFRGAFGSPLFAACSKTASTSLIAASARDLAGPALVVEFPARNERE